MNMRFALADLQNRITELLSAYPELAEDEGLRADTFEGETDLNSVLARLLDYARDAETMNEAIELRRGALQERAVRYRNKHVLMRNLIQQIMEHANLSKVTLPEATLSISHRAPSPVVADAAQIPEAFMRVKKEPNMAEINAAIKAGTAVPGVSMSNGSTSLTIRTR